MTPVSWNTLASGNRRRVHGKWRGYRDGNVWKPIDAGFRHDGSAFVSDRGPLKFHVPQFANQQAILESANEWDIWSKSRITSPAMVFEITPEHVQPVAGRIDNDNPSQVWFDDAWGPGLSLRYTVWQGRAPRATREAVIDPQRCPRGRDLQASWLVRAPKALTLINGARPKNPDGSDWTGAPGDRAELPESGAAIHYFDGQLDPVRGSGFKGPRIWYWKDIDPATGRGTLVSQPAQVTAEIVTPETIRLTKQIPEALINAAAAEGSLIITDDVQTIYPDADAETVSCDGYVGRVITPSTYDYYGGSETYAQLIANPGTEAHSGNGPFNTSMTIYHFYGSQLSFYMRRLLVGFDLSALTGAASAADLVLTSSDANAITLRATGASPVSPTGVSTADYQSTYDNYDTSLSDDTASGAGTTTLTMNAAGLSYLSGLFGSVAFLAARLAEDKVGGTRPGVTTAKTYYQAEYTGQTSDPYLDLTYGAAGGGGAGATRSCAANQHCLAIG